MQIDSVWKKRPQIAKQNKSSFFICQPNSWQPWLAIIVIDFVIMQIYHIYTLYIYLLLSLSLSIVLTTHLAAVFAVQFQHHCEISTRWSLAHVSVTAPSVSSPSLPLTAPVSLPSAPSLWFALSARVGSFNKFMRPHRCRMNF